MSRHPEVVWAQRSDKLYLTVELADSKDTKVNITPEGKFTYSAKSGSEEALYEVELELFGKINVEASKLSVGPRHTFCALEKEEKVWWKRLLKAEGRTAHYIKIDWNKWVDEDEEDEKPGLGGNFDMGGMNDFSNFDFGGAGMGGLGGEEEGDDEADEDLPELETDEKAV